MTTSLNAARHDPYAALRIPEFRVFLSMRFILTIAIQIEMLAVGWQVYDITKDPLSLGLLGLVEALPSIAVALYAGHIADLYNRKSIVLITVLIVMLGAAFLCFSTTELAPAALHHNVFLIYAVIFVSGTARGFMGPAVFGYLSQIVPRELYPNSSVWSSGTWQAAAVAGPAAGGLLYGFFSASVTYAVASFLLLGALSLVILLPSRENVRSGERQSLTESLTAGLKFVFGNQIILGALSLDLFAVLFGGAVALLPIYADTILHVGPKGLGFLRAAPSVGAILMAMIVAHRPLGNQAGRTLLLSVAGFGVCMIVFGISRNYALSLFILALSGAFDNISVIIRSTIMQTMTPDSMKGRVSAVNNIFVGSSNEIGAFESGTAARLMGVVPSVVFGGCMTILVVLIVTWRSRQIRQLSF